MTTVRSNSVVLCSPHVAINGCEEKPDSPDDSSKQRFLSGRIGRFYSIRETALASVHRWLSCSAVLAMLCGALTTCRQHPLTTGNLMSCSFASHSSRACERLQTSAGCQHGNLPGRRRWNAGLTLASREESQPSTDRTATDHANTSAKDPEVAL